MKYTLILATDPAKAPAPGSPEEGRFFQAFFAFNQEIEDKGVYQAGSRCRTSPWRPRSGWSTAR
jgi:hypothetical protein